MVALKTGRREVLGLNPVAPVDLAVRSYPKNGKYGLGFLRKTPTEGTPLIGPGPTSGQLALNLQPNPE